MKITIGGKVYDVDDTKLKDGENLVGEITIETDHIIRTPEEQTTFETNLKTEQIKVGKEIGMKDFKKHIGIEVEGKDYTKIAEAYKESILKDANLSVDEKVAAKDKDIDTLKGTISDLQGRYDTLDSTHSTFKSDIKVSNSLMAVMPDNTLLPANDTLTLLKTKMSFGLNENGIVVAKDANTGEVMKDNTTLAPIPVKDVVTKFFNDNPTYLKPVSGGAGGGDSTGDGKKTIDTFIEEQTAKGNAPNSDAFNADLAAEQAAGLIEAV